MFGTVTTSVGVVDIVITVGTAVEAIIVDVIVAVGVIAIVGFDFG